MPKNRSAMTGFVEMDREECLRRLAGESVGRLAVSAPDWPPVIRPVSYVFDERTRSVVFRTAQGSKLTALLLTHRAAFEIDGIEPSGEVAWSVIVQGRVEEVTNAAELGRLQRSGLRPWASDLPLWMRIATTVVSGRRSAEAPAARPERQPIRAVES